MTKAQTLKSIIKKDPKPGFGSDPSDPWSTRGNLAETALLDRYLKSRGINPKFAAKDVKVAHSKTNAFKAWLSAHASDPIKEEGMTDAHTPTGKRAHALRKSKHYNTEIRVPNGHKKLHGEEVDEDVKTHYYAPSQMQSVKKKKKKIKEDTYHDSLAATQMPFDTGNNPAEEPTTNNGKKTSTAAKIIKDIRKSKMVKEDLYDHEKEDKSVAGYGKQPKMAKTDKEVAIGAGKPKAAAVLSGGTTMTGQKRDTVEIDPALRVRPGQTGMEKPQKDKY